MIHLFDHYTQESKDLHHSLKSAGYAWSTIVIHSDGFLPDGVISPFTYFLGDVSGKPLYFNQVPKPAFWQIVGNNLSAKILNHTEEKARIHYHKESKNRFVQKVEWLTKQGQVRTVDHYNRYGRRFSQTSFANDGKALFTSYYSVDGKELILENHVTGNILLTLNKEPMRCFRNRTEFVSFFIEKLKLDVSHMVMNSLSVPFFVSYNLPQEGSDVLFWQEKIYNEVPGNMRLILEKDTRVKKILVPDKATYQTLLSMVPSEEQHKLGTIGYAYDFARSNQHRPVALIVTNSDQIEHLETILAELPEVYFHIAALTEMSPKLMEMLRYPNVTLHQNASVSKIEQLYHLADIYLDINYADEVMQANRQAFIHNQLLLAFKETLHNPAYHAPEHVFSRDDVASLIQLVRECVASDKVMDEALLRQTRQANAISAKEFKEAFASLLGE